MGRRHGDGPKELAKLVPLLPSVMDFLRDRDLFKVAENCQNVSQSFIQGSGDLSIMSPEYKGGPIQALRALGNFQSSKSPTADLDVIFINHEKIAWYYVLIKVLAESNPNIVPTSILDRPMAESSDVKGDKNGSMKMLRDWMHDNFSFQDFKVFGEFCSLLRDSLSLTGEPERLKPLSFGLGRLIIAGHSDKMTQSLPKAGNILQICIRYCYDIFDFLPHKNVHWMVKGSRIGARPTNRALQYHKLVRDLEIFFEFKDSSMIEFDVVPLLMGSYTIYQIAVGLLIKYKCLPGGSWIEELRMAKERNDRNCQWFDEQTITFISESSRNNNPRAEYQIPPAAVELYQSYMTKYNEDELSKIVQEFVSNQQRYHEGLQSFIHEYVAEIRFIADSQSFPQEARNALGIKMNEIEHLMGDKLESLAQLERTLNSKLKVLELLPCEILQPYFRSGFLCKIMLKHSDQVIRCYTEYNKRFEQSTELAEKLMRLPPQNFSPMHLHFVQIFNELRSTSRMLGSSLDVALQTPVGYLPKLILYFQRMKKFMDKNKHGADGRPGTPGQHPAYNLVADTISKLEFVMEEINKGVGEKTPAIQNHTPGAGFRVPMISRSQSNMQSGIFGFSPMRSRNKRRQQKERQPESSIFESFRGL